MKDFDYTKINSVNSLYLIVDEVDQYIEESNGNKYLILASTDKTKKYWQNAQNFGTRLNILLRQ